MGRVFINNTLKKEKVGLGYEKIGEFEVDLNPVSRIRFDLSGENITKMDDLMVAMTVVNSGVNEGFHIYCNDNFTKAKYWHQQLNASGKTIVPQKFNNPFIYQVPKNSKFLSLLDVKIANNGKFLYFSDTTGRYGESSIELNSIAGGSTFSINELNSIIFDSDGSEFGVGSKIEIYKRIAEVVSDIEVTSDTTEVDFGSIDVDKNSNYKIISTFLSDGSGPRLYINNNLVDSHYLVQLFRATGNALQTSRVSLPSLVWVGGSQFIESDIVLSNSGYVTIQSKVIYAFGTHLLEFNKSHISSTFVMNKINNLKIRANVEKDIKAGSRFQLIKFK